MINDLLEEGESDRASPAHSFEHDMRNLASAMQYAVDMIRTDVPLGRNTSAMLGILDRQLDRMVARVSEFCHSPRDGNQLATRLDTLESIERDALPDLPILDVLLVDDAKLVSFAMRKLLESDGHRVRTVADGSAAIAAVLELVPDVIISDLGMPGMSGYELARYIREMPHGHDVFLVALSGSQSMETISQSMEAGFDECYEKPIGYTKLQLILRNRMHPKCAGIVSLPR